MTVSRYTNGRAFVVEAILKMLAENGPMTRGDICAALGRHRDEVASVVSRLNKKHARLGKRIYIQSWVYEDDTNKRPYPRALYALGDKKDAKKPQPVPGAEKTRQWRAATSMQVSSVFDLGLPVKKRIAKVRVHLKDQHEQG